MTALPKQQISMHGLGGSEVAAALGIHPYFPRMELWQQKVGELPPFEGNELTKWGQLLEPAIRAEYVERHGSSVLVPQQSMHHPDHDWARATPDGIVLDTNSDWLKGLEIKCANVNTSHRWGETGTDDVPREYIVQCQHYMFVTGLEEWDLAVLVGGNDYREYTIRRDDGLIQDMVAEAHRFWCENVLAKVPPPIDGTDAYRDYIISKHPELRDEYLDANADVESAAARLREVRKIIKTHEAEAAELANRIRAFIGDASGVITTQGKFTFKHAKASRRVDWEAIAKEYRREVELLVSNRDDADSFISLLNRIEKTNTKVGKPSRPFRTPRTWSKDA